ncbi:MAG: thymidine phosphorylase [Acidimicrobiia bacterium]|nr:thymidine phosphorylase [Acidimicrobiia bacterium]
MNVVESIERKRDGHALAAEEIRALIAGYTADAIPDYQMSALLMAILLRGLSADELAVWTDAMLHSGDVLDFSHIAAPKVDKHSTGGVGDKVSIPLVPMVAACGVAIPMISGRGLGHTGGTLDKLESIPGFRTALDPAEFTRLLERTGLVLAGQSETLVPADRRIYALRDVTGTVPSIPLIASSIMSKKLAEGLDALVLDVKVGSGAFMRDIVRARELARTMVGIGAAHGTAVTALITDMSQPLGRAVGNANEIAESLEVLRGGGPADLVEITHQLGVAMLLAGGVAPDPDAAQRMLHAAVASGNAFAKFEEVVIAQGGDPAVLHDPSLLPSAPEEAVVTAPRDGIVQRCDALLLGVAAVRLGAGRMTKEEAVDPGVGFIVCVKVGDVVSAGDPLIRIRWRHPGRLAEARSLVDHAIVLGDTAAFPPPLVHERVV